LNHQLDDNLRAWLAEPPWNEFLPDKQLAKVSQIFEWYAGDFEKVGGVPAVLERFAPPNSFAISNKLEYQKYNWGLNDSGSVGAAYSGFDFYIDYVQNGYLVSDIKGWFLGLGKRYGVNPLIFGSIYVGAIPFFSLSIAWLVRNLRRGQSVVAPLLSAAFFFVSAYLYLLVAGQNIPVWVYIVIAGMLAFGVWSTVRKVRGQVGRSTDYDMVVIGGGAAGLTAAGMSAVMGARTALISDNKLGGDCTWQGCVPSKSLLKAAKVAHAMRSAAKYGLEPSNVSHEWLRIIERVHAIRQHVYEDVDAPSNMEKLGVEVIAARARFVDQNSLEITSSETAEKRVVTSRYFIIATGSKPDIPKIEGMDLVPVLTNETLFELKERPQRLLVLGTGPIGVEMAQAFQRLGSDVTVIGRSAGILKHDDAELTAMLRQSLEDEGVRLRLGEQVVRFEPGLAHLKSGEIVPLDAVLMATGRRPNLESLQLQTTGVSTTEKGITVDRHCRTNVKNIFACGDITGTFLFTHMAEHAAKVAVMNALVHVPTSRKDDHVSWCTFTDPELAHVGLGEEELRKRGKKFQVYRFPFSGLDRAITESESTGLVKVFATSRGKVLGASILGAHAGEMIAEFALAIEANAGLGTISSTIHPYPTYALGNRRAADNFMMNLLTPSRVGWIRRILGLRGSAQGIVSLRQSIDK